MVRQADSEEGERGHSVVREVLNLRRRGGGSATVGQRGQSSGRTGWALPLLCRDRRSTHRKKNHGEERSRPDPSPVARIWAMSAAASRAGRVTDACRPSYRIGCVRY